MSRGLWPSLSYNGEHTVWFLLLSIVFPVVNSLLCPTCDTQECSPISNCAGGTVTDACGCCLECARLINNTCGGQYQSEGRCDEGLVCVIEPVEGSIITGHEIGICTNIQSDDPSDDRQSLSCDNVDCAIVTQPVHCPSDSVLANYPVSMDSCCSPGQFCKCLPCQSSHHQQCGPDQLPVLKTEGQSLPGNCCDIYECIDRAVFCQHVKCDYDDIFNETCPDDSFLLPSLLSPDGCCFIHQGCACKRKESCQDEDDCPSGLQKRVRKLATGYPGSCCDKSDCINGSNPVCFHNGTSRHDGETWNLNQCTTCVCREGLTFCEPVQCEPLSQCSWIGTPDDQCCPICKGCVSQTGDLYVSGSTWQQDTCVTCYCEFGQVYCQAQFCSITCSNPRAIPGECCPICEDDNIAMVTLAPHCPLLSHCLLMCIDGYVRGKDGCYQCQCLELTDEPCDLDCPNGYRLDLMGIEVCDCADPAPYFPKHRSTSLIPSIPTDVETPTSTTEIVSSSTTLLVSSTTPLPPAESTCPALIGCDRQCLYGYKNNKLGCLRCRCNKCPPFECAKKCRDGYMLNSDGCKLCKCLDSGFLDLPHSTAVPFQPVRGRRCFSVDGQLMDDGQTWWDGCRKCLCFQGHEMCELMTCPALRCPNPVMKFGNCCLTCPGISPSKSLLVSSGMCHTNNGRYVVEGETWMMDECTQCICHQGAALCAIDSCPPLLCSYPVTLTHVCCPVCPSYKDGVVQATSNNSCLSIAGTEYSHGDVWKVSSCQSCTCRDGQIHCFSQTCPLLNCKKTLLKKGHCCPVCLDGLAQYCVYNFDTYDNGESWLVDDCTTCACIDAQVVCTIKVCDLPQCATPIQVPGSCCFSCSNSTTTGQGLSNGTSIERSNPDNSADVNINTKVIVPLIVVIVILVVLVGVMLFVLICIMPKRNVVIVHKSQPELPTSTKIFAGSFVQDNSCCVSTSIYEMPIPMSNSLATDSTKLSSDSLKLSLLNHARTAASDSSFQKSQSECSPFTNTNEGAALHEEQKLLYDNFNDDANKADDERSGKADAPPARWNRYSVYLDADLRSHLLKASPNASVSNNRKSW